MGSIPGVKMVPVATLLGAKHYKANIGFSSPNKYRKTKTASLTIKSKKSTIIIIVCINRRTLWKIGSHVIHQNIIIVIIVIIIS